MLLIDFNGKYRGILSGHKLIASRTSHEFFKFFDKLKNQTCMTKHFHSILSQLKVAVQRTLNGYTCLTQDDLQNIYQCIAIILAHKVTDVSMKVSVICVMLRCLIALIGIQRTPFGGTSSNQWKQC